MGHTYAKKLFIIYVQFKFNWIFLFLLNLKTMYTTDYSTMNGS